jgi:hypothetical protein
MAIMSLKKLNPYFLNYEIVGVFAYLVQIVFKVKNGIPQVDAIFSFVQLYNLIGNYKEAKQSIRVPFPPHLLTMRL